MLQKSVKTLEENKKECVPARVSGRTELLALSPTLKETLLTSLHPEAEQWAGIKLVGAAAGLALCTVVYVGWVRCVRDPAVQGRGLAGHPPRPAQLPRHLRHHQYRSAWRALAFSHTGP